VGHDETVVRLYAEKYGAMNPHNVPLQLVPVGKVVTTPMLVDWQEFLESRFYKEVWKPLGFHHGIGFNVLKTGKRMGTLSFSGDEARCPFTDADVHLLALLAPHVCRSVTISDALNLKTIKADALEATLDALASGVYLTDRESRIVYMNRAAEHQVKTGNALRIQDSRLVPVDRAARAALARALDDAIADEAEMPDSGFTLALPEGEKAGLVATILPLNRGERRHFGGAATTAIFVQDPVVVPPFPGEAFAKLYDLTGSELRVLLAMAPGLSVKEAAEMLGISDTTAKTHLQHIYAKTGTSKQTELMHLFMSSTPPVGTA
jgi:DNA-binding CsgD family transcriptional regulator/PAS domain-containing protein